MARYSKFVSAFLAFLGVIVAQNVLHGTAQSWATAIVAGLGAALVYLVPNDRDPDSNPAIPTHQPQGDAHRA